MSPPLSVGLSLHLAIYITLFLSVFVHLSLSCPLPTTSSVQTALVDSAPTPVDTTSPGQRRWGVREVFNSNTEFPAAGSRLGLNMGESQLVGRAIMSVSFLERQDWGLSLAASWRRGDLP